MTTDVYDLPEIEYSVQGWDVIFNAALAKIDSEIPAKFIGVLGENVSAFEAVYLKSDGKLWKAQANGTGKKAIGLLIESGSTSASKRCQQMGLITNPAWTWVVGGIVYLSPTTAGGLTQTEPASDVQALGIAFTATQIFFKTTVIMSTVTGTSPVVVASQDVKLVNDAAATITEINTGALGSSSTVIPTESVVSTSLSAKADKAIPSVVGNIPKLDAAGNLVDSGVLYSNIRPISYSTLYIDASEMIPCTTNPAALGTKEYGTNDIDVKYFAFDGGAVEERVQFKRMMPEDYDLGNIKAKFFWSSDTGSSIGDTVEWGIKAVAITDDGTIDVSMGTAVVVSDALLADNGADLQISAATGALTISGTPALGKLVLFEIYRNTDGTDDMTEDAWLFGVAIQFGQISTAMVAW